MDKNKTEDDNIKNTTSLYGTLNVVEMQVIHIHLVGKKEDKISVICYT